MRAPVVVVALRLAACAGGALDVDIVERLVRDSVHTGRAVVALLIALPPWPPGMIATDGDAVIRRVTGASGVRLRGHRLLLRGAPAA